MFRASKLKDHKIGRSPYLFETQSGDFLRKLFKPENSKRWRISGKSSFSLAGVANERINHRHSQREREGSQFPQHVGPVSPDEYGVFLGRQTTRWKSFAYCYGKTGDRQRQPRVSCNKSGDFHSKSGDREIFIILSKVGRSPAKSGDLEALHVQLDIGGVFRNVVWRKM